jgi:hypothetical protein
MALFYDVSGDMRKISRDFVEKKISAKFSVGNYRLLVGDYLTGAYSVRTQCVLTQVLLSQVTIENEFQYIQ